VVSWTSKVFHARDLFVSISQGCNGKPLRAIKFIQRMRDGRPPAWKVGDGSIISAASAVFDLSALQAEKLGSRPRRRSSESKT